MFMKVEGYRQAMVGVHVLYDVKGCIQSIYGSYFRMWKRKIFATYGGSS